MVNDGNERNESFRNSGDKGRDFFMEHKEQMKLFRASHTNWNNTGKDIFELMVPYDIGRSLVETGGSASYEDERYWLTLVPMNEVTERRFLYN